MAFNIPQANVNIQPIALPDNASALANLMKGATQLQTLQNGGRRPGSGSGSGGAGKGDWIAVADPSSPEGYRLQWVPGSTDKTRQANLEVIQQAQVQRAISGDETIQSKLAELPYADVATQSRILEDIRRNEVPRLSQELGTDAGTLIDAMFSGYQDDIAQRRRQVQNDGGFSAAWDSLKIGARGLTDMIGAIGESTEQKLSRAEAYNDYRQEIIDSNAYLQDQELRREAGQGPFRRILGDTGSVVGSVGSALGELLPTAGAMIGAAAGGAKAGAAAGAAIGTVVPGAGNIAGATGGALIGGLAAGAGVGTITERQAFVNRVAADPNLSREEKLRAIESGLPGATVVGGITGAIPLNLGRVAGAVGSAATRAGIGTTGRAAARAGSREAGEEIIRQAAAERAARIAGRGVAARFGAATGLSAAELSAMNAAGIIGQNAVYSSSTGQDVPWSEGLAEGLQQGLLAAPIFAIPRTGRGQRPPAKQTPDTTPDAAASTSTGAAATNVAVREFNQAFRKVIRQQIDSGQLVDAAAVRKAYLESGRTEAEFRTWLDNDANVIESARLGPEVIEQLRNAPQETVVSALTEVPQTITERENTLYQTIRGLQRGDPDGAAQAVQAYLDAGGDIASLDKFLVDSAKKNSERKQDPSNLAPGRLTKRQQAQLAEAIEAARQLEIGAANGGQSTGDGSGGTAETTVLGRNEPGGTGRLDNANNRSDSGVETTPGAIAETATPGNAGELTGSNRAVESGGVSRPTEPLIGQGEAVAVPAETAGAGTGRGADTGPSAESATPIGTETGEGAGIAGRAELGTPSGERSVQNTGAEQQSVSRLLEAAGRAFEESGSTPSETPIPGARAIPTEPPTGRQTPTNAVARINSLTTEQLAAFTGNRRAPVREATVLAARQRALDVMVRDALGDKLNSRQQNQLRQLRDAGIEGIELPPNLLNEISDARAMDIDVNATDMVRAEADSQATIEKLVNRIWCGAK